MIYKVKYTEPGLLLEDLFEADTDEHAALQTACFVCGLPITAASEYGEAECRRVIPGRYSPSDRTFRTVISEPVWRFSAKSNPAAVFQGEVAE